MNCIIRTWAIEKVHLFHKPAFLCALLFYATSAFSQQRVKMEERPLVIPTYQVAPPDKAPIFYTGRTYQGAQGHIYPHPMYDMLTDERKNQTYRAVYIDNEYTELCVLPELGGRIYSAVNKTDGYDFFYRNRVIKPALIGMIGAWISGGVEWNIPDHHRASSQLPVDYTLQENKDGSKTVWVGETELSRELKWMVGLTLYPGRSYVEATVQVSNPTPFNHPFLYWANVSVHTNENYQVIFPPGTQYGAQHAKGEFTTWPIGQGHYGGLDRTGVDLSLWKNHPNPLSIFAWNFTDDFLAGYDFGKSAGTVHVANHHVVGGKKFFLWGNNKEAKMWEKMLTDADGQYLELMVGAYSDNQPDYSWIAPGETRVWKQYWYPIKKIGGVKKATVDAAVNFDRTAPDSVKVGFNATALFKEAQVVLMNGGKALFQQTITIDPATPFLKAIPIEASAKDGDLKIVLKSRDGKELVSYTPVQPQKEAPPQPVERPKAPKDYATNEELYLTALRLEQFRNATIDPAPYYEEALKRDSLDSRVNTALGIRSLKDGKFNEAEAYLKQSLKRLTKDYTTPKEGEPYYYSGVALQHQHRNKEAADAYWKATWYNGFQSAAFFRLAQLACLERDYTAALALADRAINGNNLNAAAQILKAYNLQKLGKTEAATALLQTVQERDPLDHWAAAETYFGAMHKEKSRQWNAAHTAAFKSAMAGNPQNVLTLVSNYGTIGAYEEAIEVLQQFRQSGAPAASFPLLSYYEGYYLLKSGNRDAAKKAFAQAADAPPDYCFPFRLHELDILSTAIQENSTDAKAHYYLGNLYYYLNQKEAAIRSWEQSAKLDDGFYLVFRNLGFAYNEVQRDLKKAVAAYQKAIALNAQDARLFAEADVLQERLGVPPAERLRFLTRHLRTLEKRDDAITRVVLLYNQTGAYDKALHLLTARHFHVWEGGGDIHDIFVDAALLKGLTGLREKRYAAALQDFEQAATYPENLEVGEPGDGGRKAEVDYFIAQAYAHLKNKAKADEYYKKAAASESAGYDQRLKFYSALALQQLGKQQEASQRLNEIAAHAQRQLATEEGLDFFSKFGTETARELKEAENHYLLGLAHFGKGESEAARNAFKKAVAQNPNHVWARTYLNSK